MFRTTARACVVEHASPAAADVEQGADPRSRIVQPGVSGDQVALGVLGSLQRVDTVDPMCLRVGHRLVEPKCVERVRQVVVSADAVVPARGS